MDNLKLIYYIFNGSLQRVEWIKYLELSQTLKAGLMLSMMQLRPLNVSLFEFIYE